MRAAPHGEVTRPPASDRLCGMPVPPSLIVRSALRVVALLAAMVLAGGVLACNRPVPAPPGPDTVRVMTFNLWHGGDGGGLPLERTADVIRVSGADVVGLQETHGREHEGRRDDHGVRLAEQLGWAYVDQGHRTGILSRWPIVRTLDGAVGVVVRLPSGRELTVGNVHLAHAPYQPYQLLRIPYEDAPFLTTAVEAVEAARAARAAAIEATLAQLQPIVAARHPVVLTGDFNEPSHRDWTARAAAAHVVPMAVPYPTTLAVETAGLQDAFRLAFPDEVARPGWTWTPTTRPDDPTDRHDRIDFVHVAGADVIEAAIVGEDAATADLVVQPWPSDHRAVVATLVVHDRAK